MKLPLSVGTGAVFEEARECICPFFPLPCREQLEFIHFFHLFQQSGICHKCLVVPAIFYFIILLIFIKSSFIVLCPEGYGRQYTTTVSNV